MLHFAHPHLVVLRQLRKHPRNLPQRQISNLSASLNRAVIYPAVATRHGTLENFCHLQSTWAAEGRLRLLRSTASLLPLFDLRRHINATADMTTTTPKTQAMAACIAARVVAWTLRDLSGGPPRLLSGANIHTTQLSENRNNRLLECPIP
jgi:hypothetical protein